ncbi:hypothetical protein GCM10027021_15520 [Dyella kyungheensis]
MHAPRQRLHIQRLRIFAIDAIAHASEAGQVAEGWGWVGHSHFQIVARVAQALKTGFGTATIANGMRVPLPKRCLAPSLAGTKSKARGDQQSAPRLYDLLRFETRYGSVK